MGGAGPIDTASMTTPKLALFGINMGNMADPEVSKYIYKASC